MSGGGRDDIGMHVVPRATSRPIRHVAVVVPARNEESAIGLALDAIDRARAMLTGISTSCVVVLDDCTDSTASAISSRAFGPDRRPDVVEVAVRCAGAARAVGFDVALSSSGWTPQEMWLASTDADTIVPPNWLSAQLQLVASGADAVAGIVELGDDADERLRDGFRTRYRVDADGTHRHVHGANLGMRGDAYLAAGGWSALHTGEDHDLWKRLGASAACISSTAVVVRTSARLAGRAPAGFAADLRAICSTETVA